MAAQLTEVWSPPWASHVVGRHEPRVIDAETGIPEAQKIEITCGACKAQHRLTCESGRVRQHITTFARQHLHRDPLKEGPK